MYRIFLRLHCKRRGWVIVGSVSLLLLMLSEPVTAEIYKYIKNGVVHYTDQPPENVSYTIIGGKISNKQQISSRTVRQQQPASSTSSRPTYSGIISRVAMRYDLNPELIKAVVKVESNFNHKAISPKGAKGLMQLMPATAKRFGVTDVFDPEENITGGTKFIRYLFNEFGEENLDLVLAGYNAGEQAVRNYGNNVPPYKETQHYVKKVKALFLTFSPYMSTNVKKIYTYMGKNGIMTFTNIPQVN